MKRSALPLVRGVYGRAGVWPLVAARSLARLERIARGEPGSAEHGVHRRASHAQQVAEQMRPPAAAHALDADLPGQVDAGESRAAMRSTGAVAEPARTLTVEPPKPLVQGLPAHYQRLGCGDHAPAKRAHADAGQMTLEDAQSRLRIEHTGPPSVVVTLVSHIDR